MNLTVVTTGGVRPVHLSVLGVEVVLDGLPHDRELTFTEDSEGVISIALNELYMEDFESTEYEAEEENTEQPPEQYTATVRNDEVLFGRLGLDGNDIENTQIGSAIFANDLVQSAVFCPPFCTLSINFPSSADGQIFGVDSIKQRRETVHYRTFPTHLHKR